MHQGAYRGRGHAVLSGARLGDDARAAHAAGQEYLAYGVVYLVCTGVVQVFALQIDAAAGLGAQRWRQVEGRGAAHVVAQQDVILLTEVVAVDDAAVVVGQRLDAGLENLGDEGAAKAAEVTIAIYFKGRGGVGHGFCVWLSVWG